MEHGKIILTLTTIVLCGTCHDFDYEGKLGPKHWGEKYQTCIGKQQSPIDIDLHDVKVVRFPRLQFEHFDKPIEGLKMTNNGHTVLLSITKGKIPMIYGGPLKGKYKFLQLHFHWGVDDNEGSENKINHISFPLEMHIVFYKTTYHSFNEALEHKDGLAVLSFLYTAVDEDNKHYYQLEDGLFYVRNVNDTSKFTDFPSLDKMTFKKKQDYFTYVGSLTTPPCTESVTWIEFSRYIPLAHKQIESFREMSGANGKLTHNFRPLQPVFDRVIRMNKSNACSKVKSGLYMHILCLLCYLIYPNICSK